MRILNSSETSILVYIDTNQCIQNSDGSYTFTLIDPIYIPRGFNILVSLGSAEIPFSFYTTNTYNNGFTCFNSATGVVSSYTFPSGNYTPAKLRSILEDWMRTNVDSETRIAYDPYTNKFTFSRLSGAANITIYWNINSSRKMFGFSANQVTYTTASPVTSDLVCNLNYTSNIFLQTSLTDRGSIDSLTGTTSNILQKIPINTQPRGIVYYTYSQSAHKILYHTTLINQITFNIVDDERRNINLNGLSYSLSILFDFVKADMLINPDPAPELGNTPVIELPVDETNTDIQNETAPLNDD